MTETDTTENTAPTSVTCPAEKDPSVRKFIMAAMLLGIGIWCWLDAGNYPPPEAWDFAHINKAAGYAFNHWTPWVALPFGVFQALRGFLLLKRVLTADAEGMGYKGKDKRPWDKITALDASCLKSKGILGVKYEGGEKLVLDSWELQNFRDLVGFVEAHSPVPPTTKT
ncbi:MAG: hypothetical protein QGH60_11635 [Phycisphaerae bacterium]|nr:hypothetical protein [Phycisphaerae bacterium]